MKKIPTIFDRDWKGNFQDELESPYSFELQKLLNALDDYFINGTSSKLELGRLLVKHGIDLSEPISMMDILSGYCKRYDLEMRYSKKGYLQIRHTKQSCWVRIYPTDFMDISNISS